MTSMKESTLTQGKPARVLLQFALPIIFSMFATQFYAAADSMIVGRMMGQEALAAVSNAANVMSFFLIISGGMELGGSLLVAGRSLTSSEDELQAKIWNLLVTDLIIAIAVSGSGLFLTRWLLVVTNTPAEIMDQAMVYGRIYLLGLPFLMEYDLMREILIGSGDSKKPMHMILLTSALNILCDVLFIPHWGIAGAAFATAGAQMLGCFLTYRILRKSVLHLPLGREMLNMTCVREIGRLAPPYMFQQSSLVLLSLFRQAVLGPMGTQAIAGYSAAGRITTLMMMPVGGMCQALTVYVSQNVSLQRTERIKAGIRASYVTSLVYLIPVTIVSFFLPQAMMTLFASDNSVIQYGCIIFNAWPLVLLLAISQNLQEAVMRGHEKMHLYLVSSISTCLLNIVFTLFLTKYAGFNGLWIANIIGNIWGAFIAFVLVRRIPQHA